MVPSEVQGYKALEEEASGLAWWFLLENYLQVVMVLLESHLAALVPDADGQQQYPPEYHLQL